ncbi:uncharacterized protein LOC126092723 [Schistocerca cancellata]|uniref:uncharacterized protein LOC126092723 n=1 Tax=Schistocerca cancellata TaxID=274614 RepID=UPI0021197856|nr:uncharacterized protein LOC126092723 [Schistocerca cancellata]
MSKHQKLTKSNTKILEQKQKTDSAVNPQNNMMNNNMVTEWYLLPQQVTHTERMRGDSSGDEDNLFSSKDVMKGASEMFFGKKEDKSSFEDFPSLVVEKEKKLGTEPYKYFGDTQTKDTFGEMCPVANIVTDCSTRTKLDVTKSWNKESDNAFSNNSDVSLEGEDLTSKRRVDISHSSDDNENHRRNQPLLQRLWKENCNKAHCNMYKRKKSNNQILKKNENQDLIKDDSSPSVSMRNKVSLKQIPERKSSSDFGTQCVLHNLNTKSYNNQSRNNLCETKTSYNSIMKVSTTYSPSNGTFITNTRNYDPVQSTAESSRPAKLHTFCEVKKPVSSTNTANSTNIHASHTHNADNTKLVVSSTKVNRRTTSTPYSIPGSVCFSSKTGISPIESVKNYSTFRKNRDKFDIGNSLDKPVGTVSYQMKHGFSKNNLENSGLKLPSVARSEMSDAVDEKRCKEIESYSKKETEPQTKCQETCLTTDSNEYSLEEIESKNSQCLEKSLPPPKHLNKNHRYELPLVPEYDQEEKRSCIAIRHIGSETKLTVGEKDKKSINSALRGANNETEVSNNHSVEECELYSASLSSFSSRVSSEVSAECHLNSDILIPLKRSKSNKWSVVQKLKDTETYCHKEKIVSKRSRETVKYRHSIIALSQEQGKTVSETANEDNEDDSSCQLSEGNVVQNLLASSLRKRMKVHQDYSGTVIKTIANTAAELTTCCQDKWQNTIKEYEEKIKNSFVKVNTMLQESVSYQNEFHKFLKKYSSESQKRYMTIKEEVQALSTCTKKMCESLDEIGSYKEDICSQKIQETKKLLYKEADQMIARETNRNRALVHGKVGHALSKRKK